LLPHLSLDERLAQQLHAAQAAGDVMMIDCSSDEEDAVPPPPLKKEIVMEKVVVPPKKVSQEEESEYEDKEDDEEEYSDEDDGEGYEQPSREPESGDTVFVTWDDDPTEYLCIVEDGEDGKGLAISSADMKFTETLKFDPELDIWKFSSGNVKNISDKARSNKGKKKKIAKNPNLVKAASASAVTFDAVQSQSLSGLRFVITGIDEVYGTEFGDHCSAIISSCGGRVTTGVSGVTDYLVAGTIHHNPFLGTYGPIEGGSKYKKAMTSSKCKIIGLEDLEGLVNGEV